MGVERAIRHAAVGLIVSVGIAYVWLSFPLNREDKSRLLDFSEFYAAGEILRHGLGHSLYDLKVQAEFQLQVAPVHAFYLRPPFEALFFIPFTYLGYRAAYMAWIILSLGVLFAAAMVIRNNTNVLNAILQYTRGIPVDLGLLFVLFLTFAPTMNCLLIGQDSVLMLLIYTLVFRSLKRGRECEAGGLLASGLFKFHLVLPFVIIFALRRRWSFLLGFSAITILLAALSVLVSGPHVIAAYPKMFLNPGYRKLMSFQPEYAANIRGLIYLIFHGTIPVVFSAGVIMVLSSLILLITARTWNEKQLDLCFSAAVIATLLTGFHSFVYDLSLLLLPVAIVCGELAKRKVLLSRSVFNTVLAALFIPSVHHLLIFLQMYALMSLVLLVLFASVIKIVVGHSAEQKTAVSA